MLLLQKSNNKASSRRQINIRFVKDGILCLPGNHYRLILQTSSINFELKSEAEQDALIETYQAFLNSLVSPMQIVIRVREIDMHKYLEAFSIKRKQEEEPAYRAQITHYTDFVKKLVTKNKILSRQFYIVLPYDPKEAADFGLVKEQLALSADIVSKGLGRLGMNIRKLSSLEVLDLFYSFYNPGQANHQLITEQTMALLKKAYL